MRRPVLAVLVIGSLALCGEACAQGLAPMPPNNPWCPSACCSWKSRRAWCPNDYCPKTLPAPPPRPPFVFPNDYCKKTMPAPPPRPPFVFPNDYCKKQCPVRIGPCVEPWYTCGVRPCNP